MPKFSKRSIYRQSMNIFRRTGRTIALYVRNADVNPNPARVPSDIYKAEQEPAEQTSHHIVYVFGAFEQTVDETESAEGRLSNITGKVTVPVIYKAILAKCDYIDPYLNGSRFEKVGADVDEEELFTFQYVKEVQVPQTTQGESDNGAIEPNTSH